MRILTVNLFKRRVRKPRREHIMFLLMAIGWQFVPAVVAPRYAWINALLVLVWLVVPCADPKFGNGRPFFWQRHVALILGAVLIEFIYIFGL